MTTITEDNFQDAETLWDLERLYIDLAEAKGELLTPTEQLTLRGLLCGYTPAELAEMRVKNKEGQRTNVSRGVGGYVKKLMKVRGYEVPERMNSVEMLNMLKQAGYKKTAKDETEKILPRKNLETVAKMAVVINANNEISGNNEIIHIEIERLTLSFSVEQLKDLLNLVNTVVGGDEEKKQLVNTLVNLVKTVVGGEKKEKT
jgi:hypothetical protein